MEQTQPLVLVVEDEEHARRILCNMLEAFGYRCESTATMEGAEGKLSEQFYHLVLLDIALPDGDGLQMLSRIKRLYPDTMVIMSTGVDDLNTAVEAMKHVLP